MSVTKIMISRVGMFSCLVTFAAAGVVLGHFTPPRYRSGRIPPTAIQAVGGGEVLVEVAIDEQGHVDDVRTLRATPPFTEDVVKTVHAWTFTAALQEQKADDGEPRIPSPVPVPSKALVAAWFRPPTINTPTLGTSPRDIAMPSDEIPFPIVTPMPIFPIKALFGGGVLLECLVGVDGHVEVARVLRSGAIF